MNGRTIRDCRYCLATWPTLADDEDEHEDARIGDIARVFAQVVHERQDVDDAIIGQFMDDAAAVVTDFPADVTEWAITDWTNLVDAPISDNDEVPNVDFIFKLNGIDYIVPQSEWEPAHPVRRDEYLSWFKEARS